MNWSIRAALVLSALLARGAESAIEVQSWDLSVLRVTDTTVTIPFHATQTFQGNTTTYDFDVAVHSASLNFGFDHSRSGAIGSQVISYGTLYFTATEEMECAFEGWYSAMGAGDVGLSVHFVDMTTLVTLFQSAQHSRTTLNEAFTLGAQGGDYINLLIGSPTGTMASGHEYYLYYNVINQARGLGDGGLQPSVKSP